MKRKHVTIKTKVIGSIILTGMLICIGVILVGFILYSASIKKQYNERGYAFGQMILSRIDVDEVAKYTETWEKDDYYDYFYNLMMDVHEASGAYYTYIVVPDENYQMRYVFDSSGMDFGTYDPIHPDYAAKTLAVYKTGQRPDDYFIRHSKKYGYLTSSLLPVVDSKGDVVAVLFVDISMDTIEQTLQQYVGISIVFSFIAMALLIMGYIAYMQMRLVKPLMTIRDEAVAYSKEGPRMTDVLKGIHTGDEIQEVAEAVDHMEQSIIEYIDNLQSVTAEKERIGAELNVATQIQLDMLPRRFPAFPEYSNLDIYATMNPAKEVGGDFYDFFKIDDTHIGLVMADVSGKGVPAALFMVISKTLIKTRAMLGHLTPAQIFSVVNNQLCEGNDAGLFCTCWMGILNIETGNMVCSSAGHEYPAIRDNTGKFSLIKDKHCLALAAIEDAPYTDYEITLHAGDALFVYTDGVPEATNADDQLFEEGRMIEALNISPMDKPEQILATVKGEIDKFVGDAPQFDDITMLCLHFKDVK